MTVGQHSPSMPSVAQAEFAEHCDGPEDTEGD